MSFARSVLLEAPPQNDAMLTRSDEFGVLKTRTLKIFAFQNDLVARVSPPESTGNKLFVAKNNFGKIHIPWPNPRIFLSVCSTESPCTRSYSSRVIKSMKTLLQEPF